MVGSACPSQPSLTAKAGGQKIRNPRTALQRSDAIISTVPGANRDGSPPQGRSRLTTPRYHCSVVADARRHSLPSRHSVGPADPGSTFCEDRPGAIALGSVVVVKRSKMMVSYQIFTFHSS